VIIITASVAQAPHLLVLCVECLDVFELLAELLVEAGKGAGGQRSAILAVLGYCCLQRFVLRLCTAGRTHDNSKVAYRPRHGYH
jgi:hypothetical protein